jgi:hypothetical protein
MKSAFLFCLAFFFCCSSMAQFCRQEKYSPEFDYTMFRHYQENKKGTVGKGILIGALAGIAVAGTVYFISEVYIPRVADQPAPSNTHLLTYGISGFVIGSIAGAVIAAIHDKKVH